MVCFANQFYLCNLRPANELKRMVTQTVTLYERLESVFPAAHGKRRKYSVF